MKFVWFLLAAFAVTHAAVVPQDEYLPPTEDETIATEPSVDELAAEPTGDGYQYKTVRRLKYRQRRDVSEPVAPEYLPPSEEVVDAAEPTEAPEESAVLADDGYRYKTVRRLKYRKRRDVSELIAPGYLPPSEEVLETAEPTESPEDSAVLADDGYRYKTVRRLKYRKRRDVSKLVAPEYLPPSEEVVDAAEPTETPEESAVLADDGYRYKTVRRLKYRKRRDVSDVVSPEYLPPTEEEVDAAQPTETPAESAVLADDGYRYKTVRRLKYRKRRDVSKLVAPEYLPPNEKVVDAVYSTEAPEDSAVLADDGYRYKTVRRLKYRKRRDVSELVPVYLPPTEEEPEIKNSIDATEAPQDSAVLADDGYRYKTIKRLRH